MGTLIFMQGFKLVIGLVRNKSAAIFLEPTAIGLMGLLNTTLNLVGAFTGFGFSEVSVKEIASHSQKNKSSLVLQKSLYVVKRTGWLLGILGLVVFSIASLPLSYVFFYDFNRYYWFIVLGFTLVCMQHQASCLGVLKGLQHLKTIVFSGMIASFLAVLVTVSCYYFYKESGIVWAILGSNIVVSTVFWFYTKDITPKNTISLSFKEYLKAVKPLLSLGGYLSLNAVFGLGCHFLIKMYLKHQGIESTHLGFYEVSIAIFSSYIGLIFGSLGTDFFPKLCSVFTNDAISNGNIKAQKIVFEQIELLLLLATPLVLGIYWLCNPLLTFVFSKMFLPVGLVLKYGLLSVLFKAVVWPIDYVLLATGNKQQFFKQQLLGDVVQLMCVGLGYYYGQLTGIGIAITLQYLVSGGYLWHYVSKNYGFRFPKKTSLVFIFCLVFCLMGCVVFCNSILLSSYYFTLSGILFVIALFYCFYELNSRISFIAILKNKFFKNNTN